MTIVAGVDLETTGLDFENDKVVEVSYVIMEVGRVRPLHAVSWLIYDPAWGDCMRPEISAINGITNENLKAFGSRGDLVFGAMADAFKEFGVEYVVAHNGMGFDRPMLKNVAPTIYDMPWIDSRYDIEYPSACTSLRLGHLAADHGFVNPFPHTGLSDVLTMLRVVGQYDFQKILDRHAIPWIIVRALSDYSQKDLVKAQRYRWEEIDGVRYPKQWVKKIKECDFEKEVAALAGSGIHITKV